MKQGLVTYLAGLKSVPLALLLIIALGCDRGVPSAKPSELVQEGWQRFRLGQFEQASHQFSRAIETAGPAEESIRLQAIYGLANIAAFGVDRNLERAKGYFQRIISESPDSDLAAWAALGIIRAQDVISGSDRPADAEKLDAGYAEVIARYPKSAAADDAFLFLQALRLKVAKPGAREKVIEEVTARINSGTKQRLDALYDLLSTANRDLNKNISAYENLVQAIAHREVDPGNPNSVDASAVFRAGVAAQFDAGDFAAARKIYASFSQKFPRDPRGFSVKMLMEEMDKKEAEMRKSLAGEGSAK